MIGTGVMGVQTIVEGELVLTFPESVSVEQLDRIAPIPAGMKLVDLVIESKDRILLVEIKDPFPIRLPAEKKNEVERREREKITGKGIINEELVPKARDSYTYLHLMERDARPMHFIFLSGHDRVGASAETLINLNDRLEKRLRKETSKSWKRQYVEKCSVHTESSWNRTFPDFPVERMRQ